MRRFITVGTVVITLFAMAASAQVRGKARLQGVVTGADDGKPVAGAKVTVSNGSTTPIVTKTNDKGRWSALGLTPGSWNIDIEAEGFESSRGTVTASEVQATPSIKTTLARVVVEEAPTPVATEPSVPKEVIDAVNLGQELLTAQKYKEAVVEFEKAIPALPDNMSLKQVTAQAAYKAGDLKRAIELLEIVTAAPETATGVRLLLINLYLENSQLDEAKASLAKLPADAIVDATVYMNIGILFLNKNNPTEAAAVLTKAVDMDATRADTLYYRGLANVQLKKNKEAKADFEKVLALAPDTPEGRDAKQLIDSLK